jgi:hypothetical protein
MSYASTKIQKKRRTPKGSFQKPAVNYAFLPLEAEFGPSEREFRILGVFL